MSVESGQLLKDLKAELGPLVEDLRGRCDEHPDVDAVVRAEWEEATRRGRTSRSYVVWRDDHLTNVAVAWMLALVFVRFCEDNDLVSPPLLGGSGDRREVARGHRQLYFSEHPGHGDREWLLEVFHRARRLPGLADVLGAHSPLWSVGPTADGARRLIEFWEKVDPATGEVRHDFADQQLDTRFLGDLYQDLSDTAKKQYALLQTPIFVEEFILDRTLDPAIAEFGLDEVSLIDPTCGSGHFLLGAFDRLAKLLADRHVGEAPQVIAQRALHAIAGVDLNPAAAAIARFRLLVAALQVCGSKRLADLPEFELNVAVGDSLLHGRIPGQTLDIAGGDMLKLQQHSYSSEDVEQVKRLLFRHYHAVVGNPPYITVKDGAMNSAYRNMFKSCSRKYALSVPFFERFFDLAVIGGADHRAGFVGMITASSFMKRLMGKVLVEQFLPAWDITHVIDTSGAKLKGHPTGTAILFGRNRAPQTPTVRAVLGRRGESGVPVDPARGKVWTSIVSLVDLPGSENEVVSVTDLDRSSLRKHPWSIGGGGASELKDLLDGDRAKLVTRLDGPIGFGAISGMDELAAVPFGVLERVGIDPKRRRPLVTGDSVRDWRATITNEAWFPYADTTLLTPTIESGDLRWAWPLQPLMAARSTFSKKTYRAEGRPWWEWHQISFERLAANRTIVFAEQATHGHFVINSGGHVFAQTAPVLKLSQVATLNDHLELLGVLNSSTACFWLRQVCFSKGSELGWQSRMVLDGGKLQQLPLPDATGAGTYAERLQALADERDRSLPGAALTAMHTSPAEMDDRRARAELLLQTMISVQEELDWYVYGLYGLVGQDFTCELDQVPPVRLGERAFEIAMARQIEAGELETTWFTRHKSTPLTDTPDHWPSAYRELVERRIACIEGDRDVALLEQPECKRRWSVDSWETTLDGALRGWLLRRLESVDVWGSQQIVSTRALAERVRADADFLGVAELYRGRDVDLVALVTELVAAEAVPFLAAWRYTPEGLRTYGDWCACWDLQRRVDAGEVVDTIPVPPKFKSSDFRDASGWALRGSLDVPKERFISYPGIGKENDPTPLVGWAGWNHLERAQALSSWYSAAVDGARPYDELVSLLAGLWELTPWLRQWHNEIDPNFGERLGDFFTTYTQTQATALGRTTDDLSAWRPPALTKKTRARK